MGQTEMETGHVQETIEVQTGQVKAARAGVLRASAVGSCVAVAVYEARAGIGGLAHVMLPGAAPDGTGERRTRYAEDGIRELVAAVQALGAGRERLLAFVVGGGNILERDDDTICEANTRSVLGILEQEAIPIEVSQTGGTARRSICLDVKSARISYTVGDSASILLWQGRGHEPMEGGDA